MSTATAPPETPTKTDPPESPPKLLTVEDLLAMPDDDDVSRELIRGRLIEEPMTRRSRPHSTVEARIAKLLGNWNDGRPAPRGEVPSGEASFKVRRDPDTLVGIDVAYAPPELVAATPTTLRYYDGPPALAVEILSPTDTHERIVEKVNLYLDAGVVVWEVDPDFRRVTIHRPGSEPVTLNVTHELVAGPELPGFRAAVSQFFE